MKTKKAKAEQDVQYREIINAIAKEKAEIKEAKITAAGMKKQMTKAQKELDDNRRAQASEADKEILDQIKAMRDKYNELMVEKPTKKKKVVPKSPERKKQNNQDISQQLNDNGNGIIIEEDKESDFGTGLLAEPAGLRAAHQVNQESA